MCCENCEKEFDFNPEEDVIVDVGGAVRSVRKIPTKDKLGADFSPKKQKDILFIWFKNRI